MTTEASFDATALTRLRRVTSASPSPCGRFLAVAVERLDADESAYVSDLWRVSLVDAGAAPLQLTRGACQDTAPEYRSDGALGFLSNRNPRDGKPQDGDEERKQVWILPADGGEPQPLTDEPLGVRSFRFARLVPELFVIADVLLGVAQTEQRARALELKKHGPTGLRFDRMPVRYWDHWLGSAAPHVISYVAGERRDLTRGADREHRQAEWDVSADGRQVVVTRRLDVSTDGIVDVSLLVIDVPSGRGRELGGEPRSSSELPLFSPDGSRIACVRLDRRTGEAPRSRLWLYSSEGWESPGRALTSWEPWPTPCAWTADGSALLVTADVRGHVPVCRVDIETGDVMRVTSLEAGGSHFSVRLLPDGASIVGLRHRTSHPPEPFAASITENGDVPLLARLSGFLPEQFERIARSESFDTLAPDGGHVQAFLLTPTHATHPHPLLLWVHGGPMNQWSDGWHWRWNPLVAVSAGFAVLLPNPRGSTGFGQDFLAGIWNNQWGGACFRDLISVLDAACARPDIDAQRMAAMGGSFGGYMANWMGGSTDRFACLVTHAGIYDFRAFHATTDHPGWFALEQGGTPEGDPSSFSRYSPHTQLSSWHTPTLIVHGEKDYRVPISEALLLFEALQRHGVESELLVFPDENHWITRPRNTRHWYEACLGFLQKHLAPR